MTDYLPRLFHDDASLRHLGEGLLACTLAREEWTHEAHLGTTMWLALERPDINLERELPEIIRAFNESVGGVNEDHQGYHETITQTFLVAIREHIAETDDAVPMAERVNTLLLSEKGQRNWPLRYYSKEKLFSVKARRSFIDPDILPLPVVCHKNGPAGGLIACPMPGNGKTADP